MRRFHTGFSPVYQTLNQQPASGMKHQEFTSLSLNLHPVHTQSSKVKNGVVYL